MLLSNDDMQFKIESLEKFLNRSDIIGYAAARNVRRLKESSEDYYNKKLELFNAYGESEIDEFGNKTGRLKLDMNSDGFKKFKSEICPLGLIKHEVTIFKIPYAEVIGKLTGSEILEIDWMLEDSDKPEDV